MKAWCALLLPKSLGARDLLKMEYPRFLAEVVLLPAQILRRGRRLIIRLLQTSSRTPLLLFGARWLKRRRYASRGPSTLPEDGPVVVDLNSDVEDLIPDFLERCQEAAEALQGIDAGEGESARRIGHNLKGVGSAYSLPMISMLGASIEAAAIAGETTKWQTLGLDLQRFLGRIQLRGSDHRS